MPDSADRSDGGSSGGPADGGAAELRAERRHLASSREALRRMREEVLSTETALGDASVDKYTNAVLQRARERRAEALAELPDAPLFFGRLTYPPGALYEAEPGAPFTSTRTPGADFAYIGRRNVRDTSGASMVLDWRAPVSAAFYRAGPQSPMGVLSRRRYGFGADGALTAFEDEDLTLPEPAPGDAAAALLAAEIERPRTGPMRDIVATIQPDQDDLVRASLDTSLCVQGAPGTGKTAVGLHRIAYLLYAERERLRREGGVAIVGPSSSFLSYIRNVLPALGEAEAGQLTLEELAGRGAPKGTDSPEAARLKGDARMAEVVSRALWAQVRPIEETLVVTVGSRKHRVPPEDIAEIVDGIRRQRASYGAGRGLLAQRLGGAVQSLMEASGGTPDAGTRGRMARSREVKAAVAAMWPKADPVKLVFGLLSDPGLLARAAEGVLDPEEQAAVRFPGRPRSARSAPWSPADLVLIDEAACLVQRPPSLGHIVLDEAQDLSPMQCRAVARRVPAGSVTVLGDIAQGTAPAAARTWADLLRHLGKEDARMQVLSRGYRVPAQIIDFAARLLPEIAPDLPAPSAARQAPGALRIEGAPAARLTGAVLDACKRALDDEGSIGVIAADARLDGLHTALREHGIEAGHLGREPDALEAYRVACVPASLAKGLEFDTVVAVDPAEIADAEERGLNRLYVVLTRAVSRLHVVHSRPLPEPLG
ncbi:HelD family protein [Nocardiopsis chromatogenes]|uniref:HelD family protein n=1 Tax=Nocardiopsis chromatogenes TaxID=280239 RepID=UPI0003699FE8